jgi:DNA-binding NarL/FixJ family response regulator
MRFSVCFIDDSDFEHELVRTEIAANTPDFEFVQTYTFDEARRALGSRIPVLFLLDLWGQDPAVAEPSITGQEALKTRIAEFKALDRVYDDIDPHRTDHINEYLKRLFTIVDGWRRLFEDVCDRAGQNRKYGLANLQDARTHYPGVPAVFYTRKSLINDAVAMFQAGANGLLIKPTGPNDEQTRAMTRANAPALIKGLSQIVDTHLSGLMAHIDHYRSTGPGSKTSPADLINEWKAYRTGQKT